MLTSALRRATPRNKLDLLSLLFLKLLLETSMLLTHARMHLDEHLHRARMTNPARASISRSSLNLVLHHHPLLLSGHSSPHSAVRSRRPLIEALPAPFHTTTTGVLLQRLQHCASFPFDGGF
jgi:hypothetical protein